jgi:hypothetical protein
VVGRSCLRVARYGAAPGRAQEYLRSTLSAPLPLLPFELPFRCEWTDRRAALTPTANRDRFDGTRRAGTSQVSLRRLVLGSIQKLQSLPGAGARTPVPGLAAGGPFFNRTQGMALRRPRCTSLLPAQTPSASVVPFVRFAPGALGRNRRVSEETLQPPSRE